MTDWTGKYCTVVVLGTNEVKPIATDFTNEMPRDANGVINGTIDQAVCLSDPVGLDITNTAINGSVVSAKVTGDDDIAAKAYTVWFRAIMSDGKEIDSTPPMLIGGQLKTPQGTTP